MSSLPKLPASEAEAGVDLRQSDFKAPILKIPPHYLQSDVGGVGKAEEGKRAGPGRDVGEAPGNWPCAKEQGSSLPTFEPFKEV